MFCEDRAFIRAVVSLPQETFYSSGASVKASLLFLQKFTVDEQNRFNEVHIQALAERRGAYQTNWTSSMPRSSSRNSSLRISIPRAVRDRSERAIAYDQARAPIPNALRAAMQQRSG